MKTTKKKLNVIVIILLCMSSFGRIYSQNLVDSFEYSSLDGKSLKVGIWNESANRYRVSLIGASSQGTTDGFRITGIDLDPATGSQNITNVISTTYPGCADCILKIEFDIPTMTEISRVDLDISRGVCPTLNPCTISTASNRIRLTWSNESTEPVDVPAPTVPSEYAWNNTDQVALLTALGYPNGKIYQTDYKSSDFYPTVTDDEATLIQGMQSIWIGDPLVSNKRSPMTLLIDPSAEPIVQARPGVGINTEDPQMSLDVNGLMRSNIRDPYGNMIECNMLTRGSIAYDHSDDNLKVCKLNGWSIIDTTP